jgi:uncharacterized membrane protein
MDQSLSTNRSASFNLTTPDRVAYAVGGAGLLAWGLGRRPLGFALAATLGASLLYQAYSGNNPLFKVLGIRVRRRGAAGEGKETIFVSHAITIDKPREELYRYWRNFENLPRFMDHLESVEQRPDGRSHWCAKGPAGARVEWDAEITEEIPNALVRWRSLPDADVANFGTVRFREASGGRGTEVAVDLEYQPPAGALGTALARLLGEEPQRQIEEDLRRLKQLMETGEVATTVGQPAGAGQAAHMAG